MKDIVWTNIMLKEFRSLVPLSDEENAVLNDWALNRSVVETAFNRHMSERTVNNLKASIRVKYDAVQIFTPLLPERIR